MGRYTGMMIASDLDGTFMDAKGRVVQRNIDAISAFCAGGGLFTFATGRHHDHLPEAVPGVERLVNMPVIVANGSYLYDFSTERVLAEVLEPLKAGKPLEYGVFNCSVMAVDRICREEAKDIVIVEGAYSLHPQLRDFFDLKVLVTVDEATQKQRILARNGEKMLRRFLNEWIPLELRYFEACGVKDCCDLIL